MKRIINYIWPVLLCFGIGFAEVRHYSAQSGFPYSMVDYLSANGAFIGKGAEHRL